MQTRRLGRDGPEISVVGFGAWEAGGSSWGEEPPEDTTIAAMHAGIDAGMNWIDTAETYGKGRSEELVRRALEDRPGTMVFTKLAPRPSGSGFGGDEVRKGCEASLARLGRDVIDLYQLHWPDERTPLEETWEAMAALVDEGLVRHIGLSNFRIEQIERCESIRHVDSLQSQFSMFVPKLAGEVFPYCESNGTGVLAYGPLAYGLLTGAFTKDTTFPPSDWRSGTQGMSYYEKLFAPGVFEGKIATVDALKPVAQKAGVTMAQLALAWIVRHSWATGAIAGSRSPEHTAENAAAGDVSLEPSVIEEVERILG